MKDKEKRKILLAMKRKHQIIEMGFRGALEESERLKGIKPHPDLETRILHALKGTVPEDDD